MNTGLKVYGTLNIDAIVYDMFGELASGVLAWPEGRPEDTTYILGNGELIMTGISPDDIIVFKYFDRIIAKIPASQIGSTVEVDKTIPLDVVPISNKPKNNLWLKILGFGATTAIAFSLFSEDSQKVNL